MPSPVPLEQFPALFVVVIITTGISNCLSSGAAHAYTGAALTRFVTEQGKLYLTEQVSVVVTFGSNLGGDKFYVD